MSNKSYVYINGEFVPSEQAKVSVWDRGFLYGDGFFTTIRAENGKIFFLKEHLERLRNSCEEFGIKFPSKLYDLSLFKELIRLNGLTRSCAAIRITITRGVKSELGLPYSEQPTYVVFTRKYHPPVDAYKNGWKLISFKLPISSPICLHKSLNYLYNLWARQYAIENGCDEAILIGVDGYVKETSVGTILFQKDGIWFTPDADFILPGITLKILSKIWSDKGIKINKIKTKLEELFSADQVWVLNSLIGIVPVKSIDGHDIGKKERWEFAEKCRKWLWQKNNRTIYSPIL